VTGIAAITTANQTAAADGKHLVTLTL
jgi:hypothetical protein